MQFVDLKSQFNIIEKDVRAAIDRVLQHQQFIMGPEVAELEKALCAYTGAAHTITAASGTDALLMVLLAYDLQPQDAVIVPSFTFAASAEVVKLLGGEVVFVDVREDTFNIDTDKLTETIAAVRGANKLNLRGIIAVDLFGQPADYVVLQTIARDNELFLIADAAQSFGASLNRKKVGGFGDITTTSFFPAKPLGGGGDGGAIFTADANIAKKLISVRQHGMGKDRYEHVRLGITGRLDTIQAAIINCKLKILDKELDARRKLAERYNAELADKVKVPQATDSAWAQYTIRVSKRDAVVSYLRDHGIPTAIYYPRALHQQPAYQPREKLSLSIAEQLAQEVLSLPIHPYLGADEQSQVIKAVRAAVDK